MIFRDMYFASLKKYDNLDWFWRMEYDLSGLEVMAVEKFIAKKRYSINDVNFAHYFKANYDGSATYKINRNQSLVLHGGFGIIANFGQWLKDTIVEKNPFSKQFALGGNNSMRGWQYLELEPGGYQATSIQNFFTQSGDIRFELNLEWRFNMFWRFEGAAFVDVGNIWNINKDVDLPDADFVFSKALDQLAVASGLGLRFDASLFMIRFDAGFKTRFSYPVNDEGSHFNRAAFNSWSDFGKSTNLQIAIDYPF